MLLEKSATDGVAAMKVMQAKLHFNPEAVSDGESVGWSLDMDWSAEDGEHGLEKLSVHALVLGGASCRALVLSVSTLAVGRAFATGEDLTTLVFLMNPADVCVWQAMDDWLARGRMDIRVGRDHYFGKRVGLEEKALFDARAFVGDEMESDVLGGMLQQLIMTGELSHEIAKQLSISGPVCCALVDTPMLRESMKPVDEKEWREHLLHLSNRWVFEGIWS